MVSTGIVKFDPVQRLSTRIESLLQGGEVSRGEVLDLFRIVRLVLEERELRRDYPSIALYADWLQHGRLDRQASIWQLAERLIPS